MTTEAEKFSLWIRKKERRKRLAMAKACPPTSRQSDVTYQANQAAYQANSVLSPISSLKATRKRNQIKEHRATTLTKQPERTRDKKSRNISNMT